MSARATGPIRQQAVLRGQGNVNVQIVGEGNQVTIRGAAALRLTMFPRRREEGGEIGLLSAYTQSIPLIGRARELADLRAWLKSERDIAIQIRTGAAGTGKTRLAFDLSDQLANGGKWQAGFVNGAQLENLVKDAGARWGWERPTLAVVDYAAERPDVIHDWFAQLADFAPTDGPPLRILLLERQADPESGWLQRALGLGSGEARTIRALLDPPTPLALTGLVAPEDRRAVLDAMFQKLGSDLRAPEGDPEFERRLAELSWGGEPLFLMMAALLAAQASLAEVLALPRTEIAHEVARREIDRTHRLARERTIEPELLAHLAAYVTLSQGLAREALLAAIEAEAGQLHRAVAPSPAAIADALVDALAGRGGRLEPIRPDPLGEAVVLRVLGDAPVDGVAVVRRAFEQSGAPVAAFVVRSAQDFAAAGHEQPLAWLDGLIEDGALEVEQLMLIADQLPETSLALVQHAARLTDTIAVMLRERIERGEATLLPALAGTLSNLAVRLVHRRNHKSPNLS